MPESPLLPEEQQPLEAIVVEAGQPPGGRVSIASDVIPLKKSSPPATPDPGDSRKPPVRVVPVQRAQNITEEPSFYPFEVRPQDLYRPAPQFRFESPGPAKYVVPRTFGMSAILGIITALAVLFGGFQLYNAHPVLYLFFGVQAVVICLAQMAYGRTPRAASAITGGLLLPIFVIAWISLSHRRHFEGALCLLLGSVPIGAFFGYVTGTMAAGVFLVMDAAEQLVSANRSKQSA